jgi:IclR family KDG regulon transcriptional repressor
MFRIHAAGNGKAENEMKEYIQTGIQVLDRAFYILDIVSEKGEDLTAGQIAAEAGLNRSTTYRIAESLAKHGYLEKKDNGKYNIGTKIVLLAGYSVNNLDLISIAQPYLWKTAEQFGQTCYLAILSGTDVIFAARADSFRKGSIFSEIGLHYPAYTCALGWCLLSQYSSDVLRKIMSGTEYRKTAVHTVSSFEELANRIHRIRTDGYAYESECFRNEEACLAVPVYNYCGDIIAAISIAGRTDFSKKRIWNGSVLLCWR